LGLYDNALPSVYEEIRSFYPVWYWDVLEMDAIWQAQGFALDHIRFSLESIIDNSYIETANSAMITAYERFLGIPTNLSLPLEERRKTVIATLYPTAHIGAPEIKELIYIFTSGQTTVGFKNSHILIAVDLKTAESFPLDSCVTIIGKRIPAHLRLDFLTQREPISTEIFVGGEMPEQSSRMMLEQLETDWNFTDKIDIRGIAGSPGSLQNEVSIEPDWRFTGTAMIQGIPGSPGSLQNEILIEPNRRFTDSVSMNGIAGSSDSRLDESHLQQTRFSLPFPIGAESAITGSRSDGDELQPAGKQQTHITLDTNHNDGLSRTILQQLR